MKMVYYRSERAPNFGDELNHWLWPQLLGDVLDEDDNTLLLGIGSILNDSYPQSARKIVLGAGYGAYDPPPVLDANWDVRFVRGPQTAACLGLPAQAAVTDGAVLLRALSTPDRAKKHKIAYMPHWESLFLGEWQAACRYAGIRMIDPRLPVETVLEEIAATEVLMAEAMHGVIVADALRVPWIAVFPNNEHHRFKWTDWTRSVGLPYKPRRVLPSSRQEWYKTLQQGTDQPSWRRAVTRFFAPGTHDGAEPQGRVQRAAWAGLAAAMLQWNARSEPMLSDDRLIASLTERAMAHVEAVRTALAPS